MPGLTLKNKALEGLDDIEVVAVHGTLDVATIPDFESNLENLRQQGKSRLVIDLEGLEYISSSGLGAFLGMVDGFRDHGGDLAFINLSDRVRKIFTVVGFIRILTILSDLSAAMVHFNVGDQDTALAGFHLSSSLGRPHSGEAFELQIIAVDKSGNALVNFEEVVDLKPSTGIVSPAHTPALKKGAWKGPVILTGPGIVTVTVAHGETAAGLTFDLREDKNPATLPCEVRCPRCGVSIQINQFNVFRCKQCDEVFFVDKWAHAISLRSPEKIEEVSKIIHLKIPADVNLLGSTRIFLASSLRECGYSKDLVNDMELCLDEAVTNVVEHAYGYDIGGEVNIQLSMGRDKVTLVMKDQGKPFNPKSLPKVDLDVHIKERKTGGLGYYLMNTFMDEVTYEYDGTSNILSMVKNVAASEGSL